VRTAKPLWDCLCRRHTAVAADTGNGAQCWRGFKPGSWQTSIDIRDFIVRNATPYTSDEKFVAGPSKRTLAV
jgi:formate C-acetyltransferase